jgi:hypothetical protein
MLLLWALPKQRWQRLLQPHDSGVYRQGLNADASFCRLGALWYTLAAYYGIRYGLNALTLICLFQTIFSQTTKREFYAPSFRSHG